MEMLLKEQQGMGTTAGSTTFGGEASEVGDALVDSLNLA